MITILKKEINDHLSHSLNYVVLSVFVLINALYLFLFSDTSILNGDFAEMNTFFNLSPLILMFIIPALTMRTFSEEIATGTLGFLMAKPIKVLDIVVGKYLGNLVLGLIMIVPTLLIVYSVYHLSSPIGNIDMGSIMGSYIGLIFLISCYTAIGIFSSSLTKTQLSSFIIATFLCFLFTYGMDYISKLPILEGNADLWTQKLGVGYHYDSMSKGVIDSRDVVYFLSVVIIFIQLTWFSVKNSKK